MPSVTISGERKEGWVDQFFRRVLAEVSTRRFSEGVNVWEEVRRGVTRRRRRREGREGMIYCPIAFSC